MRFLDLVACLPVAKRPNPEQDPEIYALSEDSRTTAPGSLFFCLRGAQTDGHLFADAAYARGCRAFVCEYPVSLPRDAAVVYVPDAHHALALLAAEFYGHPERALFLVGITGTKGKTTTALMLRGLLSAEGVACGYIGSSGILYADIVRPTENTTPSALALYAALSDMRRAGVDTVVLEVSSQAIACGRIDGLSFPVCIFTNLANDHIGAGEHPDLSHYRQTKARLFSSFGCESITVNADDESTAFMLAGSSATEIRTVSLLRRDVTLFAERLRPVRRETGLCTTFSLACEGMRCFPVSLALPGACNVTNALLALSAAQATLARLGREVPPLRSLASALLDLRVPGRFSYVKTALQDVDLIIDYAHNGYSMAAAIRALRAYEPKRILCLFGSVGGRTYSRRTELAEAASAADLCIVTTDDPDNEPPEETMRELCTVLAARDAEYVAIADRAAAIRYAVACLRPGDILLLAGKGDERYQLIDGRRVPFSEEATLRAAVEERNTRLAAAESVPIL